MSKLRHVNLVLRWLMELAVVVALAWWGAHTGSGTATRIVLGIAVPVAGFGFWGLVDFRRAGRLGEPLRLLQELAISLPAAAGAYTARQHALGWTLGLLSIVHHTLVYALGDRLLGARPGREAG